MFKKEGTRGKRSYEERWFLAQDPRDESPSVNAVEGLNGNWRVRRLTGPVPMSGIFKVIASGEDLTGANWSPFPELRFELEQIKDSVMLAYRSRLSFIRGELRREVDGRWLGRATIAHAQYAWVEMVSSDAPSGLQQDPE